MRVVAFSSFTFSYLDRARVLFSTLRKHHPDWELVALMPDHPPPGIELVLENEPFDRVVWFEDLDLPRGRAWLFGHDIIEASTAVKGPFLHQICESGAADIVIYLDPDTALLNDLSPLVEALQTYDGLLTPHLLEPEDELQALLDNELATLRTGIFNLGFVAIRTTGQGARFAKWWNDRLLSFCYDDIPRGLFVDQRWCDHVPAFFDRFHVLRDPGYNVASWNLSKRKIQIGLDGVISVNGSPLRFWHFTKLGPTGDTMTRRYAGSNFEVYEIWNWYRRLIQEANDPRIPPRWWAFGSFADGSPVQKHHRELYRTRADLQAAFSEPFESGPATYQAWLAHEGLLTAPANAA